MAKAVVELRTCTRDFGGVRAVDAMDLAILEGEFLSLLGPSGCGKTTTLNLIAGFVEPTAGRILIDGEDVTGLPAHRRGLGVVFQSYALFPHLSVFENVAFGLRERRVPAAEIERRVAEALALVRLDRLGRQKPAELSGGMQQRVALARALVYRPRVLLLDEPLAALDKKLREEMRDELRAIQRSVGITTVFVTHDQAEALGLSDRIAVMSRGRIEQLGTPRDVYERPATRFVADFIGASTILRGRAIGADLVALSPGLTIKVSAVGALAMGRDVELAIRPERVHLAAAPGTGTAAARIEGIVYQGALTEVTARLGDGQQVRAFVTEPARHQRFRLGGQVEPVEVQPAHAADLQHVTEPARGDEAHGSAAMLDDGVGDHGRSMGEGGPGPRARGEGGNPVEHALRRIGRRGRHLAGFHPSGGIPGHDVGEGAAHVDADAYALNHASPLLCPHHGSSRQHHERVGR